MEVLFYLPISILGLFFGSFLNCVIYRLENSKSFLKGRSFCPSCSHTLSCYDLIPVLSFLFLRGKCRYCKKKISWQYPLVELGTALVFLLTFIYFSLSSLFFLLLASCFLIIVFVFDLKHYIIPDRVIYPAILIALFYRLFEIVIGSGSYYYFLAGMGAALFFLLIVLISKGKGMGIGDIKLALFMGFLTGYPNILLALFLAFLIGAIIGIGLILAKKKEMKSEVPFGPFLVIGTFIALFWGDILINWYLNFFNLY